MVAGRIISANANSWADDARHFRGEMNCRKSMGLMFQYGDAAAASHVDSIGEADVTAEISIVMMTQKLLIFDFR